MSTRDDDRFGEDTNKPSKLDMLLNESMSEEHEHDVYINFVDSCGYVEIDGVSKLLTFGEKMSFAWGIGCNLVNVISFDDKRLVATTKTEHYVFIKGDI